MPRGRHRQSGEPDAAEQPTAVARRGCRATGARMPFDPLENRIVQAVRENDGQLDWRGLAAKLYIFDPMAQRQEFMALSEAITALRLAGIVRLEFDDERAVRFWINED
jgi:hypothetical protein